jgi:hypothetical protein
MRLLRRSQGDVCRCARLVAIPPVTSDDGSRVSSRQRAGGGHAPMVRRYTIGALLLDLGDPRRAIAHLPEPFLEPAEDEPERAMCRASCTRENRLCAVTSSSCRTAFRTRGRLASTLVAPGGYAGVQAQ